MGAEGRKMSNAAAGWWLVLAAVIVLALIGGMWAVSSGHAVDPEVALLCIAYAAALVAGGILYFLPTYFAYSRRHPMREGVFAVNLFLGWTLLGWVGSLTWAVSYRPPEWDE